MPFASMLDTNKPFMFAAPPVRTTAKPSVLQRPLHKQQPLYAHSEYNNQQPPSPQQPQELYPAPARLSYKHETYAYKKSSTNTMFRAHRSHFPAHHHPHQHHYRIEEPSANGGDGDDAESWFEGETGHNDGSADNKRVKRRKELMTRIEKVNADFVDNRERIYTERLEIVKQELKQVHDNTHIRYAEGLADLHRQQKKMIDDGRLFCEYQQQVTESQFELEIYMAEEEYMAEKQDVREKLFAVLEEKRRRLKEDKDNCDLAFDVMLESQSRMHRRNLRKRAPDCVEAKSSKRKQTTGPALNPRLKEDDIHSDLQAMRDGTPPQTLQTAKKPTMKK